MAGGEPLFSGISEIIGRRHRISDLDPGSGTFEIQDDDRAVRVVLEPDLLAAYSEQLDEHDIPGLSASPRDAQDRIRVKHITMCIEEIFESDIHSSLLEIRLARAADGRISLSDRRGAPRRSPISTHTETGYWSPDRPDA
ncbi:hypothetical protein GCM10010156_77850 [Planobispora rosea]|uniref:Uncharacterized protein n=1 Tax=Planobispora rosea TaxID=35762 RepID=A0A8J3SAZ1_PLARO|nr:hypothetical protein [Planobispora rosea]GGT09589.1 hypothetical protein GCM10010156_77850 [Planobispora rosea]GIH86503.1 hypothetical protein Pro02_49110 [Planobispora rosea]